MELQVGKTVLVAVKDNVSIRNTTGYLMPGIEGDRLGYLMAALYDIMESGPCDVGLALLIIVKGMMRVCQCL